MPKTPIRISGRGYSISLANSRKCLRRPSQSSELEQARITFWYFLQTDSGGQHRAESLVMSFHAGARWLGHCGLRDRAPGGCHETGRCSRNISRKLSTMLVLTDVEILVTARQDNRCGWFSSTIRAAGSMTSGEKLCLAGTVHRLRRLEKLGMPLTNAASVRLLNGSDKEQRTKT